MPGMQRQIFPRMILKCAAILFLCSRSLASDPGSLRRTKTDAEAPLALHSPEAVDTENESSPMQYIINGDIAPEGRYPWFAQPYRQIPGRGYAFGGCGATLIAPDFVLTAAHCAAGLVTTHFEIGTYCPPPFSYNNCNENSEFMKVKAREIHWNYRISPAGAPINDFAIFQLNDTVKSIDPIIPDDGTVELASGDPLTAIGVGVSNQATDEDSDKLHEVELFAVSGNTCGNIFPGVFDSSNMMCASRDGLFGTCIGDSGGPLINRARGTDILVGITSFGAVRCGGAYPDIFASVGSVYDWIKERVCSKSQSPPEWCSDVVDIANAPSSPQVDCTDKKKDKYMHNYRSAKPFRSCKWLSRQDPVKRANICRKKKEASFVCEDTCLGKC